MGVRVEQLRAMVQAVETAHASPAHLATGVAGLDTALGGGLAITGVSELAPAGALDEPATLHCALALTSLCLQARQGDLVLVLDPVQIAQWGMIHAHGLALLGIDPARVLLVTPRTANDVRACVEEAARASGIGAVLGWLSNGSGFDLVPARRVQLAAEEAATPVLLASALRTLAFAPARARLSVSPHPSALPAWVRMLAPDLATPPPGNPAWDLSLIRARSGGRGRFAVEFDHASHHLRDLAALEYGAPVARPAEPAPVARPAQGARSEPLRKAG